MGARRVVLLILVAFALVGVAPSIAAAQEDSGGESVRGTLEDAKGTREQDDDEPVEGAEITVTTVDGEAVGTATTDEEGRFELELPGPGPYVAELDTDTLPDGVGLAEGAEVIEFTVRPNQSRPLIFDLGARERTTTSRLDQFPQLVFEGFQFGLIIAICAVGLVNFAHGELCTWGAMVAWFLNVDHGIHLVPAVGLALLVGAATGALLETGLWKPLRNRGVSLVAMMIVSIGLSLAARNFFQLLFGESTKPFRDYNIQRGTDIGPITLAPKDVWVVVLALAALLAVASALTYTRIGKATRAVSDNPDLAASSGINVDRVIRFVWGSAGALAALGGILFAVNQRVQFDMGFKLLLLMFAGVTLGGLGTAYGALVGSLVVGMFIQVSTVFIPTELKNVGALVILIVVLMIRPQGILGRAERVG
jgi:branched-chain amino acid transport system permease protein